MIGKTSGGRWRVRVKFRGSVVADRTFDRKADASRWEGEQKRLLATGDFVDPSAGRITVKELAEEYIDYRNGVVSVRSWESDYSAIYAHIVPAWGRMPLTAISNMHIDRFLSQIAQTRSVRTAARIRTTVRGLFAYGVRTRRLQTSPAENVALPRPDSLGGSSNEIAPFTQAELASVIKAQRDFAGDYADITLVLATTGLRFGELRGLRVGDIGDVPYPCLIVRRSLPQSGRTGAVIERTTTKGGDFRTVPLVEHIRPAINTWANGKSAEELLFPAPEGGYLSSQNWRRKVHWSTTALGRRPHDLRHTAASLWIAAGMDIKTVSSWLGHASAKLTLDTYGHIMGTDADRAALSRLNQLYGDATGTQRGKNSTAGRP